MDHSLSLIFVLLIFGLVLFFSRKMDLGYSLFIGTALMGIAFRMAPHDFFRSILEASIDPTTLTLLASIFLILVLNETLKASGRMEILVSTSVKLLHDIRLTTFFLPALIGTLPMPGGAYFSAPMVDSTLKNTDISPEKKLFANYWFRHTGEYINPMYPGIVTTAALTGLSFQSIVKANIWLTLTAIAAGAIILFGKKRQNFNLEKTGYKGSFSEMKIFLKGVFPLLVIIILVIFFGLHIVTALSAGTIVLFISCRLPAKETLKVLRKALSWQMFCMILGIVFFQKVLAESGAVEQITAFLKASNIGLFPVITIVPFLSGFVTGITLAAMGLSLPLLLPLLPEINSGNIMFIFACGFAGVLLSPVHLCLLITCQYFKVRLISIYRYIIPSTFAVVAVGFIGYIVSLR